MKVELDIVAKPLERAYKNMYPLKWIIIVILSFTFLVPLSFLNIHQNNIIYFFLVVIAAFIANYIVTSILKPKYQQLLDRNLIGKIIFEDNFLSFKLKSEKIVIPPDYEGSITFSYEGYRGESVGIGEGRREYFGTSNYIKLDKEAVRLFHIYLANENNVQDFNTIIEWSFFNKIQTAELFRGERRYGGEKLKFAEIQAF